MEAVIRTRLTNELKEKFVKIATEKGVTVSDLIREYIESLVGKATK